MRPAAFIALCLLVVAAFVVVPRWVRPFPVGMPITLELVGLTNLPPVDARLLLWRATDIHGAVSGLTPASPSHVLFQLKNCTKSAVEYRPMGYQFADSLPPGMPLPKAPYRDRGGTVGIDRARDRLADLCRGLIVCRGMQFGPPDYWTSQRLGPGETILIALPRPPFDCVWRAGIGYELPLTKPQLLLLNLKKRLHIRADRWQVVGGRQWPAYDEWMYGRWITNAVLNKPVSLPDAVSTEGRRIYQ
jgi:hypothetical protein